MKNPLPCPTYPCNLISRVLGKPVLESDLPADIDGSIHYACSLLSSPNAEEVLTLYFKDGLTQKIISERYQCDGSRINFIISTSINELSLGNRSMLLTHGYAHCVKNMILGPWLLALGEELSPDLLYDLPVFELGLNVRTVNGIYRAGARTVGELIQITESELKRVRNLGVGGIDALKARLADIGISLATE